MVSTLPAPLEIRHPNNRMNLSLSKIIIQRVQRVFDWQKLQALQHQHELRTTTATDLATQELLAYLKNMREQRATGHQPPPVEAAAPAPLMTLHIPRELVLYLQDEATARTREVEYPLRNVSIRDIAESALLAALTRLEAEMPPEMRLGGTG